MGFSRFQLHPKVLAGVQDLGYVEPTPIQDQSIPHGLAGKDVLGLAQTGTGKTAAFGLPILHRLLEGPRGRVRALVLAPTRELAEQIHEAFGGLGRHTGLRSATVYGGVGMGPQERALRGGAEIIVACPGRLLDHCGRRVADLSHVEILVIDEADRMFDMGFLPDVRRIMKLLPAKRQTLFYSATMPEDIRRLAHDVLREHVTVQVSRGEPVTTVSHALYPVREHLKTDLLLEILRAKGYGSTLVFTRTKHRAKRLGQRIEAAGYAAASLQGNLSQNRRKAALDGFRQGTYEVLVATDIAARGIDVSQITHVINFDMPDTVDAYTHRIGRTGRAARTGDAFTLSTQEDEPMVRAIERVLGSPLERRTLESFDYGRGQASGQHRPRQPHPERRGPTPQRPHAPRPHASPAAPSQPKPTGPLSSRSRRPWGRRGR